MTITLARPVEAIAPRDKLATLAPLDALPTARGTVTITCDADGHIVELRDSSGYTYKYARRTYATIVTEVAPNGAVDSFVVPATRQAPADITHLFD
jgi:hypothetical protein